MQLHGRSTADADAGTGHVEAERGAAPHFTKTVPLASSLVQRHSLSLFLADGAPRTGPWILNPPRRGSGGGLAIVFSNFLQRANLGFNAFDACQPLSYDTGESLSNQETMVAPGAARASTLL